jgi:synaptobrevin homolog YKT6
LKSYQNPYETDKLLKIHKAIDDVKDIMQKNIEEILNRGENLETLLTKSDDLSVAAIKFHEKTKSKCCVLL